MDAAVMGVGTETESAANRMANTPGLKPGDAWNMVVRKMQNDVYLNRSYQEKVGERRG